MKLFAFAVVVVAVLCIDAAFGNVKFRSCGQSTVKKIIVEGSDNKATPTLLRYITKLSDVEMFLSSCFISGVRDTQSRPTTLQVVNIAP